MRLIGARFSDHRRAEDALIALRERPDLTPSDLAIAPMTSADDSVTGESLLLTGSFADEVVPEVVSTIERHWGEVVAERLADG